MRSLLLRAGCLLLLSGLILSAQTTERNQSADDQVYFQWLSKSLASIQTIKVGMTRRDLLTFFREDGGLQFKPERYVYKQCPIIKVDVTFTVAETGDPLDDQIKSISKPYLENPFYD